MNNKKFNQKSFKDAARVPFGGDAKVGKEALSLKLALIQPFASRCDFNLPFTNYTGLSPVQPDDTVLDRTTIVDTGAVKYLLTPSSNT